MVTLRAIHPCCGSTAEHHRILCPAILARTPHWQDQRDRRPGREGLACTWTVRRP